MMVEDTVEPRHAVSDAPLDWRLSPLESEDARLRAMIDRLQHDNAQLHAEAHRLRDILRFDVTEYPAMEAAVIAVCNQISGVNGGPSDHPDPVRMLEMMEAVASAAMREKGINPAPWEHPND